MDQAIAQRFKSAEERASRKRRSSPAPISTALTVSAKETALALFPPRLYWRGIAVSEEFQSYAARVASGEQLAPYRGEVLSRYCPNFPWSESTALATSTAPTPTLPKYPERGRPLKTTLWLLSSVGSLMAAIGFGAGAATMDANDDEVLDFQPSRATAALKPAAASARSAQAPESGASDGERAGLLPPSSLASADQSEPIATALTGGRRALGPSSDLPRAGDARVPVPGAARAGGSVPIGAPARPATPRAVGAAPASGVAPAPAAATVVAAGTSSASGVAASPSPVAAVRPPYAAAPAFAATTPYASGTPYTATAPVPASALGFTRAPAPSSTPWLAPSSTSVGGGSAASTPGEALRAPETQSRDTALFSDQPSF